MGSLGISCVIDAYCLMDALPVYRGLEPAVGRMRIGDENRFKNIHEHSGGQKSSKDLPLFSHPVGSIIELPSKARAWWRLSHCRRTDCVRVDRIDSRPTSASIPDVAEAPP